MPRFAQPRSHQEGSPGSLAGSAVALGSPRVAVCVCTFRRPQGLDRLLEGLDRLTFTGTPPAVEVLVVDNDATESAAAVCERWRPGFRWPLTYLVEPRRGISTARNTAVARAGDAADFIAFIDDDEVPEPQWLDQLLGVQARHSADVVAGPALPHFPPGTPSWIVRGRHFDHTRYQTGQRLRSASTNNCLVRRQVFQRMGIAFDEEYNLTGGEDRHFFTRVHRAGFNMVWADEAVVEERIPLSRANPKWILARFYRMGTTCSHSALDLRPPVVAWVSSLARAGIFASAGLLLLPWGIIRGRHLLVRHLRYIFYGVGVLAGLLGFRYEGYRHTDGT